ncbi:MAG: GNAT family protein [Azospirillaceae bacterium]
MIGFLKTGLQAMPSIRIDGERTYLRPPRARDWRAWASLRKESRAFLTPWEPAWPPDALSRAAYARRLRRQVQEWRADEGYSFLIFRAGDDALVGGVGFSNVRRGVAQMASLGYWIGARHARQGLMTDAVVVATGFAFRQLGLHRIEAACLPDNVASRALLERVGFVEEGLARDYLKIDSRWRDHVLFGLLRTDLERV